MAQQARSVTVCLESCAESLSPRSAIITDRQVKYYNPVLPKKGCLKCHSALLHYPLTSMVLRGFAPAVGPRRMQTDQAPASQSALRTTRHGAGPHGHPPGSRSSSFAWRERDWPPRCLQISAVTQTHRGVVSQCGSGSCLRTSS
ncbi:hypothetical protein XENOCAPTIV_022580 [Xenoophorus captivus]|uniref:Uncharacterized protein n=1 Tax=Xenoophorus captivus TaxID=1517983 RepID=A0ABV0Q5T8_9TELE